MSDAGQPGWPNGVTPIQVPDLKRLGINEQNERDWLRAGRNAKPYEEQRDRALLVAEITKIRAEACYEVGDQQRRRLGLASTPLDLSLPSTWSAAMIACWN